MCLLGENLLYGAELYAEAEQVCRDLQVIDRRVGRRDTDIRILRIVVVREGRTGIGQLYTGLLAVIYDRLRTARHGVEADEVTTVRLRPLTDA